MTTSRWTGALPPPVRAAVVGAAALGVVGCVTGLVLGLLAYPPTAWAAVVELGLPGVAVGAILGVVMQSLRVALASRQPRSEAAGTSSR